jgi:CSLREA domain-containing protein
VNITVDEQDGSCDDGDCSLRDALALAQPDQTVLLPPGTFTLTLGNLEYLHGIKLAGAGIDRTVIEPPAQPVVACERYNSLLVFIVPTQEISISDLTFRHGGIYDHAGQLTLRRVRIVGNHCAGVEATSSSLRILDSIIEENMGGGISTVYSEINVARSTVRQNGGAGIQNARGGKIVVESSTITQNNPGISGGGITITNSTIGANYGAGIRTGPPIEGTAATIQYSTITGNTVGLMGGGLIDVGSGSQQMGTWIEVGNSVVANKPNPTEQPDCDASPGGGIRSLGHNLIGNLADCPYEAAAGDLVGTGNSPIDPKLGPLQDNGGPTLTHTLLAGSPAIDAGENGSCPATDQRGIKRPQGKGCDIGAVEFTPWLGWNLVTKIRD